MDTDARLIEQGAAEGWIRPPLRPVDLQPFAGVVPIAEVREILAEDRER